MEASHLEASADCDASCAECFPAVLADLDLVAIILAHCGMRRLLPLGAVSSVWQTAAARLIESWRCLTASRCSMLDELDELQHPCFPAILPRAGGRDEQAVAVSEASSATNTAHVRIVGLSDASSSSCTIGTPVLRPLGLPNVLRLRRPTGLALSHGVLYIADAELSAVQRYHLDGEGGRVERLAATLKWSPYGLALGTIHRDSPPSSRQLLCVADSRFHRLVALRVEQASATEGRQFVDELEYHVGEHGDGSQPYQFDHPRGVACDASRDALVVADRGNNRLQFFALRTGEFRRAVGSYGEAPGRFRGPYGVAFCAGRLICSEFEGRRVQVLTADGAPLQQLTLPDAGACPTGVAASATEVFVSAFGLHTGAGRLFGFEMASKPAPTAREAPWVRDEEEEVLTSYPKLAESDNGEARRRGRMEILSFAGHTAS